MWKNQRQNAKIYRDMRKIKEIVLFPTLKNIIKFDRKIRVIKIKCYSIGLTICQSYE